MTEALGISILDLAFKRPFILFTFAKSIRELVVHLSRFFLNELFEPIRPNQSKRFLSQLLDSFNWEPFLLNMPDS